MKDKILPSPKSPGKKNSARKQDLYTPRTLANLDSTPYTPSG